MSTRRRPPALSIIFFLASAAATQPLSGGPGSGRQLGFRVEYFSQEVKWDNAGGTATSDLNAILAAAVVQFRVGLDSSASFLAGYCSSDAGDVMFRALPFSIDYQAGASGGLALGADFDFALTSGRRVRVSAIGEVTACLGQSKKWDIPGLAVPGSLEGKSTWFRARVGPRLAFGGEGRITPYVFPFFHYTWGNLEMRESVESLSGTETQDLRSQSLFGIVGGLVIPLSPGVNLKAEAGVYPGNGAAGFGATVATMFSF